ncbi:sarcosine oxidase subunit gamma [Bradyrhizobium sp. CCGUVB23]|uniref:sarcosine oxidase subunit gamma n=1 Tax=Bradyrhizobium sp. CCGUVB23 TaxID=2949630 RepID=UPI0020B39F5C|nr:sarcosine oxidase subunit gamma family protein [Bradyrhizobium sp. CCGUVB23]MCP3463537.1 sarcosine oxidase subunit gamma [Bradyrhizobium sp. CCGUVB23]
MVANNLHEWSRQSGWEGIITPGKYGAESSKVGVVVEQLDNVVLAIVTARTGKEHAVRTILAEYLGLAVPATSKVARGMTGSVIGLKPGSWMIVLPKLRLDPVLEEKFSGIAAVTEQSDSRVLLRVRGRYVRDALAKGVTIDLHPRAMCVGDAAVTAVAQIVVHIWMTDEEPIYELAIPRSMARSFWDWFACSSAEYGYACT